MGLTYFLFRLFLDFYLFVGILNRIMVLVKSFEQFIWIVVTLYSDKWERLVGAKVIAV